MYWPAADSLRASATETDVTGAASHRAQDIAKSYVPRRETVPREARPKILRTNVGRATARSAVGSYIQDRETVPREAWPKNLQYTKVGSGESNPRL